MKMRTPIAVLLSASAFAALAQQLYRWTDEKGRVNITDTPPPASARNVQRKNGAGNVAESQQGFELSQAVRNFPVTLYTAPACKEYCVAARALLNKRGVPFTEVQVADDASRQELKSIGYVDVYFDNVGGEILDMVLRRLNVKGRVVPKIRSESRPMGLRGPSAIRT